MLSMSLITINTVAGLTLMSSEQWPFVIMVELRYLKLSTCCFELTESTLSRKSCACLSSSTIRPITSSKRKVLIVLPLTCAPLLFSISSVASHIM